MARPRPRPARSLSYGVVASDAGGPGRSEPGVRVEVQAGVAGPGQRPVLRGSAGSGARTLPDLVPDPGPRGDFVRLILEEVVEENCLAPKRFGAVVVAPLLAAVRVQPLARRADLLESLERSPGVQALVGPAGDDERRHRDPPEVRDLGRPERVEEGMLGGLGGEVFHPVGPVPPALADVGPEVGLRDTAVRGDLPVGVAPPFPRVDRGQVRWAGRGDGPLAGGEVGHAGQADPAVAPGLGAGPLDQVVAVGGLFRRQERGVAARVPGTRDVGVDDRIPVPHPVGGIRRFEGRVGGQLSRRDPAVRVQDRDRRVRVLAVGTPRDQRGNGLTAGGPEDVGVDHHAAADRDRDVPLDDHAVAGVAPVLRRGRAPFLGLAAGARNR